MTEYTKMTIKMYQCYFFGGKDHLKNILYHIDVLYRPDQLLYKEYKSSHVQSGCPSELLVLLVPDFLVVPGVCPPAGLLPGPGDPAFLLSRLLKKLARTPSLVCPPAHTKSDTFISFQKELQVFCQNLA